MDLEQLTRSVTNIVPSSITCLMCYHGLCVVRCSVDVVTITSIELLMTAVHTDLFELFLILLLVDSYVCYLLIILIYSLLYLILLPN